MTTRRRRTLTGDEVALWSHVTRHVVPMPGRKPQSPPPARDPPAEASTPAPVSAAAAPAKPASLRAPLPAPPPSPPPVPPLAPLERRLRQRLARGHHPIEAVIDLHGMRQDEAHMALRGFLAGAQRSGMAVVLVVTGKGGAASGIAGHAMEERGVLRRVVPHWLRLPDLRALVVGFEEAASHHGGAGALYVRLRKARQGAAR